MRNSFAAIAISLLAPAWNLIAADPVAAGITTWAANLEGLQEVPPNLSPAYGSADATLDGTTFKITGGDFSDLLGNSSTIGLYDAAAGANGVRIATLTLDKGAGTTAGTFSGTVTITNAQAADILAGKGYLNLTSNVYPSGEIRGQLYKTPEPASLLIWGTALAGLLLATRRQCGR